MTSLSKARILPVVGMTFVDGYPANLHVLRQLDEQISATGGEGSPVVLVRRPKNEHDPNAIEVHAPAVGMIGHIDRENAAKLAPLLDDKVRFRCYVSWVRVAEDHPDRPGVDISIQRVTDD